MFVSRSDLTDCWLESWELFRFFEGSRLGLILLLAPAVAGGGLSDAGLTFSLVFCWWERTSPEEEALALFATGSSMLPLALEALRASEVDRPLAGDRTAPAGVDDDGGGGLFLHFRFLS